MAELAVIQLRTTSLVRLIAPTDESTTPPTPLVTTGATPSTCSFKVYDHGKLEELSAKLDRVEAEREHDEREEQA